MKKYIFFFSFCFCFITKSNAELFNLGVKGGVNFSSQKVELANNSLDPSGISGFNAGLFGSVKVPIIGLGVQAEVLYSQKGSEYTFNDRTLKNRFSYIDVPIYIRWTLDLPLVKPYIGVGPYFSFGVENKIKNAENSTIWNKNDFVSSDFGFGATIGVELINRVQISACYQLGIKNLYDGPYDIDVKNRNFAISLGFMIF